MEELTVSLFLLSAILLTYYTKKHKDKIRKDIMKQQELRYKYYLIKSKLWKLK